jgi:hypothetical protein
VNFDLGEVLSRAWQISWKHKALWVIGIVYGFLVSIMLAPMFLPALFPLFLQNSRTDLLVIFIIVSVAAFFLFILVLYPVSSIAQTALTLGALDAEQKVESVSAPALVKRSFPYFWRVLGLMVLYAIGMTVIMLIFQAIGIGFSIVTLGVGAICLGPLSMLIYPAMYAAVVWMEMAMNGIIVDDLPLMEAAGKGWQVLRNHLLPIVLTALIVYFGMGILTGAVLLPLMAPLLLAPIGFSDSDVSWVILVISIVCTLIFIPLFAILSGWAMVFTKSTWVLTYLRLTRPPEAQPLPQEAIA